MTKRKVSAGESSEPTEGADRLLNALATKVAESIDASALALQISAPVGVAIARGVSLEALTERVVEAISAGLAQDEALLAEVRAVIIKALTQ